MTDATAGPMIERHLEIVRAFEAPRDLVWTCWTDPEHFAAWWGPEHFHTPVESVVLELRAGGAAKSTMVDRDGNEYPSSGTFEEVTPKDRLVFTETDIDHPMMETQRTVVSFKDLGDGRTELTIDVTMVCTAELIPMARSGWSTSLDKLAAVLAQD